MEPKRFTILSGGLFYSLGSSRQLLHYHQFCDLRIGLYPLHLLRKVKNKNSKKCGLLQSSHNTNFSDIYWENLNVARKFLKIKYVLINIALFFVAFFLTTPEYIVSQTDWLVKLFGETLKLPAPIVDFLPTILLWSFTALLPLLVAYSDRFLGHYTRSEVSKYSMTHTCIQLFVFLSGEPQYNEKDILVFVIHGHFLSHFWIYNSPSFYRGHFQF